MNQVQQHPYIVAYAFGEILTHRPAWWLRGRCRRCKAHWPCPDYHTAKTTLARAGFPSIPDDGG